MKNKYNYKLIIGVTNLILLIILTILVLTKVTNKLDDLVNSFMLTINNDGLTKFMITITNLGSAYALISITFLITLIALVRNKRFPLKIIINLISITIISHILKAIIHRGRPLNDFLVNVSGYSYPSCHMMVSMAYFMFIAFIISKRIDNKLLKFMINIACFILSLLIGFSRLYLGVHYFTDVIGGFFGAIAYLMFYLNLCERREQK